MIRITDKRAPRSFTIANNPNSSIDFLSIFRKYSNLRPTHSKTSRFFLQYISGKCSVQVVGIHTFGRIPRRIAEYLKLPDSGSYLGHCFKRTALSLKSYFHNALLSLNNDQFYQPKQQAFDPKPSISTPSSSHLDDQVKLEIEAPEFVKVEPNLIIEDSVVQYFRNENLNKQLN